MEGVGCRWKSDILRLCSMRLVLDVTIDFCLCAREEAAYADTTSS